jgi:cyclopropane fatty-acyl-phospholipid synthase-like methyltransferase
MSLRSIVVRQFKRPHGLLGRLAGFIMANRLSNRERNLWTVGLLALEPNYRVLEIGCGPGFALKACAAKLPEGCVVGIDHSETMVSQARRRLALDIKSGRADVRLSSLSDVASETDTYDRVYSLNVVQFFPDMEEGFRQIHRCLVRHGMVATTYQPRSKNPTRDDALEIATRIEMVMKAVGFTGMERHELPLEPVPAICVIGRKQ